MQDIVIVSIQKVLHGTIKKEKKDIKIEKILAHMWQVWLENEKEQKDKKEYVDLYIFLYIGLGYLKVLCKNLSFKEFRVEYNKVFDFFKKNQINYQDNQFLKLKQIQKADRMNRICTSVFLKLHQIHLGEISLYLYNKMIK